MRIEIFTIRKNSESNNTPHKNPNNNSDRIFDDYSNINILNNFRIISKSNNVGRKRDREREKKRESERENKKVREKMENYRQTDRQTQTDEMDNSNVS